MAKKAQKQLNQGPCVQEGMDFRSGTGHLGLNRAAVAKVNQLKAEFTKNVNASYQEGSAVGT